jgi:DNA-binding GntR family transcriptional regulator
MQHVRFAAVAQPSVIHRAALQDQVYESLKERVLSGDFRAGMRLPLQTLADELAVSRTPVHNALTRLVTQKLVDIDSRGFRVRPVTVRQMEEAHDLRCVLEIYAAEQTIGTLSESHLDQLRGLLQRTIECVENFEFVDKHEYMLANKAFHEYLVDLAENETLTEAYRSLNLHELVERILFSGPTRSAGDSSDEHKAIVMAYAAGDLEAARVAIAANVETGRRIAVAMIEASGGEL